LVQKTSGIESAIKGSGACRDQANEAIIDSKVFTPPPGDKNSFNERQLFGGCRRHRKKLIGGDSREPDYNQGER